MKRMPIAKRGGGRRRINKRKSLTRNGRRRRRFPGNISWREYGDLMNQERTTTYWTSPKTRSFIWNYDLSTTQTCECPLPRKRTSVAHKTRVSGFNTFVHVFCYTCVSCMQEHNVVCLYVTWPRVCTSRVLSRAPFCALYLRQSLVSLY